MPTRDRISGLLEWSVQGDGNLGGTLGSGEEDGGGVVAMWSVIVRLLRKKR